MPDFTLENLAGIVAARASSGDPESYSAKLAAMGVAACAKKLGEEAVETVIAAVSGDHGRIRSEAADLIYHLLVLLHVSGVPFSDVTAELGRRTAESGLQEKARRSGDG